MIFFSLDEFFTGFGFSHAFLGGGLHDVPLHNRFVDVTDSFLFEGLVKSISAESDVRGAVLCGKQSAGANNNARTIVIAMNMWIVSTLEQRTSALRLQGLHD